MFRVTAILISILVSTLAKPWDPVSRSSDASWEAKHEKFLNETAEWENKIQVVFFGDSITEGWAGAGRAVWNQHYGATVDAGVHAVNYGIGGDKTENLIWRINNGEFDGLEPRLIVLKIGTNNLAGEPNDEDIAKGITVVVDELYNKTRQAKILLLGILPRGGDALQERIKNINSLIKRLDGRHGLVFYLDMWEQFSNSTTASHLNDDLFVADKLHLAAAGYKVWADTMNSVFQNLLSVDKPWDSVERDGSWLTTHEKFLNETKNWANKIQVVFFGDSITAGWAGNGKAVWNQYYGSSVDAGVHAVNYGIGGDKTENLIWRVKEGEFDGLMPKVIVLKIGTNNLGSEPNDEDIAKGITAVVDNLHMKTPEAKILLLGVLPRNGAALQARIKNINSHIKGLEGRHGGLVWYLDMWEQFSNSSSTDHLNDELFVADKLHLAAPGYEVWAETMNSLFQNLLSE